MAGIVFQAEVSERSMQDFTRAISSFQRRTQRDMRTAVRIATTDLIKSLRKQTRQAKQKVPRSAFRFGQSDPQWITEPDGTVRRRMILKRFGSQSDKVFFQPWKRIEKVDRKGRHSWTQASEASLIRDARNSRHGKIWNWGLARQTWGWFMWRLFNIRSQADFKNKRVRITHNHVDGGISESREPLPDGTISLEAPIKCTITIINRLRYIRRALLPGALENAIEAARRSLLYKAQNAVKSNRFD